VKIKVEAMAVQSPLTRKSSFAIHVIAVVTISAVTAFALLLGTGFSKEIEKKQGPAYHDDKGHYSISFPESWVRVDEEALSEMVLELKAALSNKETEKSIHYEAAFQENSWMNFYPPYVLLATEKTGRLEKGELEKMISDGSTGNLETLVNERLKGLSTLFFDKFKLGKRIYDSKRQVILMNIDGQNMILGVVTYIAIFLSKEGTVWVGYYSFGKDPTKDLLEFSQILSTFRLDKGFEY
jgi:hypothetical protein